MAAKLVGDLLCAEGIRDEMQCERLEDVVRLAISNPTVYVERRGTIRDEWVRSLLDTYVSHEFASQWRVLHNPESRRMYKEWLQAELSHINDLEKVEGEGDVKRRRLYDEETAVTMPVLRPLFSKRVQFSKASITQVDTVKHLSW